MLCLSGFFISCEKTDDKMLEKEVFSSEVSVKSTSEMSVGELHNLYLVDLYEYLSEQDDLDAENISDYTRGFLQNLQYGDLAIEYYDYVLNEEAVDYNLSPEFKNEINNLNTILDGEDFIDFDAFETLVVNYQPIFISEQYEIDAWGYYSDILVHSTAYWNENLDKWDNLIDVPVTLNDKKPCKEGSWGKRLWCNTKKYVGADVAAGASQAVVLLLGPKPVTIGAVGGSALGGSVAAIFKDLIFSEE